jgi:hypothetical protein
MYLQDIKNYMYTLKLTKTQSRTAQPFKKPQQNLPGKKQKWHYPAAPGPVQMCIVTCLKIVEGDLKVRRDPIQVDVNVWDAVEAGDQVGRLEPAR